VEDRLERGVAGEIDDRRVCPPVGEGTITANFDPPGDKLICWTDSRAPNLAASDWASCADSGAVIAVAARPTASLVLKFIRPPGQSDFRFAQD